MACTAGATLWAMLATARETPAALMRPKAPKAGKRILLERIPFLWKYFSFSVKVSCRNLFRYKKRFFMTVIGHCRMYGTDDRRAWTSFQYFQHHRYSVWGYLPLQPSGVHGAGECRGRKAALGAGQEDENRPLRRSPNTRAVNGLQ